MEIYKDSSKSIAERVEDLVSKMSIKEKVGQLNQKMLGWNAYKVSSENIELTKEFMDEVAFGDGVGAIYGLFRADGWNSHVTMGVNIKDSIRVVNEIQKYVVENTRLGIPLLIAEECPHGHEALEATTFPTNIGIGATWNPELYREVCGTISKELRARGGHLALVSTLDIATDPRWGRTEECFSEDPYLAGQFSENAVYGIQGHRKEELKQDNKAAIVLKHFCAQGATMGGHNGKSTNIGQRELREIHLYGMEKGAKAGALGCMAAYNDIDGVPCHINRALLTDILRGQMGFEGLVMSDGVGVDRLNSVTGSLEKSGAGAVYAGVDLNLWNKSFLVLEDAINKGLLNESDLDIAVKRVLKVKFELGLFEKYKADEELALSVIGSESSREVALRVAREVPVLLKNDNETLPIGNNIKNIAVIGPNSDKIYNQLGDYTQWQEDGKVITVLEGIKKHADKDVKIHYEHGCSVRGYEKDEFASALETAKKCDVVILVLGGSSTREASMSFDNNGAVFMNEFTSEIDCGEAVDLADLNLGGVQQDLAREIKALGKKIVTVLIQGRPHSIPWFKDNSDAILSCWYPGEMGGDAIGEILFGKTNPSGKLAMSVPESVAQLPVYYNRKDETNYIDMSAKPLYSFGFGLSYTTFSYNDFKFNNNSLTVEELNKGKRFEVSMTLENTGGYTGKEVMQLYIYDMESCITRRLKELKDFCKAGKAEVAPGESKEITLSVGYDELGIFNYNLDYVVEPGNVKLMIGNSSDNTIFEKIVIIE